MSRRRGVVLMLSLAVLAGPPRAARAETWVRQFVDVGSSSGASTSLGLIPGTPEYPVIAYFGSPRNLKYAALDPQSKVWRLLRVDAGGEYTSLAVDGSGIVHVGYLDAQTMQLKYWRYNQGQGSIQTIDSETGQGGMGFFNSIQVDGGGTPHISYYYWRAPDGLTTSDRLKVADLGGSGWSRAFADTVPGRGRYNSLALDASGNPRIAYYDGAGATRRLRLARRLLGVWTNVVVDALGDPGRFNSIAIDGAGQTHLSYIASTPLQLRYAVSSGTSWQTDDVAGVGSVVNFSTTSLALDSNGDPHISYYDAASSSLKYASLVGATWTIQTVDSVGDVGGYSSLKLDASDRPIISYFDATTQALKIAYGDYSDGDGDGIPDTFDPCPANADCNANGIVDGREGGVTQGAPAPSIRLPDESIFGCGSLAALYGAGPPAGGPPPADLLFLLAPAAYLLFRKASRRAL